MTKASTAAPTAPVIELRSIKTIASMSEETHCYSATLYVDGEKWGEVGNRGHGGADDFHGVKGRNYGDLLELDKRIAATTPKIESYGTTLDNSLEIICGDLVNDHILLKTIKRDFKSKVMFCKAGANGIWQAKPPKGVPMEKAIAAVAAKHVGCTILNTLPEADALALYRKEG